MRRDRFVFAIILYGIVLFTGAAAFFLFGDVSQALSAGVVTGTPQVPDNQDEMQLPVKTPEDDMSDESDNISEQPDLIQEEDDGELSEAWGQLRADTTAEWREIIGEKCIVLPKPLNNGNDVVISVTDIPIEQSIALRIQGCGYTEYDYSDIERIAQDSYYSEAPDSTKESSDPLKKMTQFCTSADDGSYELYVEFLLDKTYAYNVYETQSHYFVALMEPNEIYDRIVVLDAGHGGWDTGTVSRDGKVLEKNVNLQVLLYLQELLENAGIKVYATRTTDRYIGHAERIALANSLAADMFVSIHCNNEYQDAGAKGTEVLYAEQQNAENGNALDSKFLAQICLEKLTEALQSEDGGVHARSEELTVLQEAEVPAVQVELAYMSNAEDIELLKTETGQRAAAKALYDAILDAHHATLPE